MEKKIIQTNEMNTLKHKQKRYSWFSNSTWILLLLMSTLMWQCEKDKFEGETASLCPKVITTNPANEATIVATNTIITATFNEAMDPASINNETFTLTSGTTLKSGTVSVLGEVTYADLVATFTPTKPLEANTTYSGTITKKVKDPAGNYPTDDYQWNFTTGSVPTIYSTDPVNAASNVPLNIIITVTFSREMDSATVNPSTFFIQQDTNLIAGTVTYSAQIATFTPASPLNDNTVYTGIITMGATDTSGNAMASNYMWSFSTVQNQYTINLSSNPAEGGSTSGGGGFNKDDQITVLATPVTGYTFTNWTEGTNIVSSNSSYTFTVTANRTLVANFAIVAASTYTLNVTAVNGTVVKNPNTATYAQGATVQLTATPSSGYTFTSWSGDATGSTNPLTVTMNSNKNITANFTLIAASTYTLNVTAVNGTVVKNPNTATYAQGATVQLTATADNGYVFSGWSGDANGTNNPLTVTMNSNKNITADFTLILATTYTLDVISVNGTVLKNPNQVNYNQGTTVQLTATPNSGYKFNFWSGAVTSSSNPITVLMDQNKTITANYSLLSTSGPASVNLGSVGDFAIIAGSGVSNTGVTTMINGDVGSFPTATINGLLPGNVNGTLYTTANPIVGLAKTALTTAYNDAQSRSLNAISLPGQIGGLTLAPGLYVNSTTSGISGTGPNGILTLDAGGNANAVWIFKMGSTFVTDAGTSIVLAGGAQADNIYWSVGSSATLGTNSVFYGNILADQAITLTTGATLYGRALTRIAAVTLDSNTVTKP